MELAWRKENQNRSERAKGQRGCGRSRQVPVRGRKHKMWSHGGVQPHPSFPRELPAPHPYHGVFRRAPVTSVSHKHKYGRNFFPSPTLPGSAVMHSRPGSSHPPLQGASPSPSKYVYILSPTAHKQHGLSLQQKGGHTSPGGASSSSRHWKGSPSGITSPRDSGWLNPGMNLHILYEQGTHKRCQEALAGLEPSGNSSEAIARKYISRRVPPPWLPAPTLDIALEVSEGNKSSL